MARQVAEVHGHTGLVERLQAGPGPGASAALAFPIVKRFCIALLCGRTGRLTAKNSGFWPAQWQPSSSCGWWRGRAMGQPRARAGYKWVKSCGRGRGRRSRSRPAWSVPARAWRSVPYLWGRRCIAARPSAILARTVEWCAGARACWSAGALAARRRTKER